MAVCARDRGHTDPLLPPSRCSCTRDASERAVGAAAHWQTVSRCLLGGSGQLGRRGACGLKAILPLGLKEPEITARYKSAPTHIAGCSEIHTTVVHTNHLRCRSSLIGLLNYSVYSNGREPSRPIAVRPPWLEHHSRARALSLTAIRTVTSIRSRCSFEIHDLAAVADEIRVRQGLGQ